MEDINYKEFIQQNLNVEMIDKSVDDAIDSDDEDYIMRRIRDDYLCDSTVTIFLIGEHAAEYNMFHDQSFIKRELQSSLYNGEGNSRNGILGIVLPSMYNRIYGGSSACNCGQSLNLVYITEQNVIKEFAYNYYIPNNKCHWTEDDRYCVLAKWDDFIERPDKFIDQAYDKRSNEIANKIKVKP